MTADEEKELLEMEAQLIHLKMLNNQYSRHLLGQQSGKNAYSNQALRQYLGQIQPDTWKALLTPNTWQNKLLVVVGTGLLALLKKKRR